MYRLPIKKSTQGGFTLIELVFVIVILGILAAFAVPRFVNLSSDARRASIQGLGGSIQSAAALAHAQFLVSASSAATSIDMDGTPVDVEPNGFPTADSAGIKAALQSVSGYVIKAGSGNTLDFTLNNGGKLVTQCGVEYQNSQTAAAPTTNIYTSGC